MEARKRVTQRTERANRAAAGWPVQSRSLSRCCRAAPILGAPPAELSGFEPYRVNGRTYVPLRKWEKYQEIGVASWYGGPLPRPHHRQRRALRHARRADGGAPHAAFNVCAQVRDVTSGRSVVVRINDRGPFKRGRVIDLSRAAADELGVIGDGITRVKVSAIGIADADGRCRTA
jgi:rare lipoprotein A